LLNVYRRPRRTLELIVFLGVLLQGCSDSDSPTTPAGPTAVGGHVSKGPIAGATVNLHAIQTDGTPGAVAAGPFTTDASGNWTGEIPVGGPVGPFVISSVGGTYRDEYFPIDVSPGPGQTLYGLYKGNPSLVTPLTHATYIGMQYLVAGNTSVTDAIAQATASSVAAFGFDFATTVPRKTATATTAEKQYAALLGGLSWLLDDNAALVGFQAAFPFGITLGISRDMADGRLDGLDPFGNPIEVSTGSGTLAAPLPALDEDDLSAWLNSANLYASTQPSLGGISFNPSLVWASAGPLRVDTCAVVFLGTGAQLLPEECFDVYSSQRLDDQSLWNDAPDDVQIVVIPVDLGSNLISTIQVTGPTAVWSATNPAGIFGASRSGGVVTFTDVALPQMVSGGTSRPLGGGTTLILDGQLQEPNPARPAP
jgi:hypothetical protein